MFYFIGKVCFKSVVELCGSIEKVHKEIEIVLVKEINIIYKPTIHGNSDSFAGLPPTGSANVFWGGSIKIKETHKKLLE